MYEYKNWREEMEEVKDIVTLVTGEQYVLGFPSLRKIKKLSALLEVDLFTEGLKNVRYGAILQNENRLMEIVNLCFQEKVADEFLDTITPSDFDLIVTAFFFRAKIASVRLAGELDVLRSITDYDTLLSRLKDMNSTLPSSQLQRDALIE